MVRQCCWSDNVDGVCVCVCRPGVSSGSAGPRESGPVPSCGQGQWCQLRELLGHTAHHHTGGEQLNSAWCCMLDTWASALKLSALQILSIHLRYFRWKSLTWGLPVCGFRSDGFFVGCFFGHVMFFKNADALFIHLVGTSALNYLCKVFEDTMVYRWRAVHN